MSEAYVGGGVNAGNIKKVIEYLNETKWDGDVSVETTGTDENMQKSVEWLRNII